jgi:hypothetical protein
MSSWLENHADMRYSVTQQYNAARLAEATTRDDGATLHTTHHAPPARSLGYIGI